MKTDQLALIVQSGDADRLHYAAMLAASAAALDWEITVDEQSGAVAGIRHSGGGLQTGNCVNKALHTMSLAPYERDAGEARDTIDVVVTIR